jgi:hypothetical protein
MHMGVTVFLHMHMCTSRGTGGQPHGTCWQAVQKATPSNAGCRKANGPSQSAADEGLPAPVDEAPASEASAAEAPAPAEAPTAEALADAGPAAAEAPAEALADAGPAAAEAPAEEDELEVGATGRGPDGRADEGLTLGMALDGGPAAPGAGTGGSGRGPDGGLGIRWRP